MRAAVVTVSTSLARGEGEDRSGPRLAELCREAGLEVSHEVVSDDREQILAVLKRLADHERVRFVFTTGGTGLTADDVTPEATLAAIEREAPGYAEAIRADSRRAHPARDPDARRLGRARPHPDRELPRQPKGDRPVVAGGRAHAGARGARHAASAALARRLGAPSRAAPAHAAVGRSSSQPGQAHAGEHPAVFENCTSAYSTTCT